ncbi:hypothetical protein SAMN04488000_109278, partial [Lentzea albida]
MLGCRCFDRRGHGRYHDVVSARPAQWLSGLGLSGLGLSGLGLSGLGLSGLGLSGL